MAQEILQFLMQIVFTAAFFLLIWLVTRFYKPKDLEIRFTAPRRDVVLAVGYVVGLFLIIAVVFSFLVRSAGGPLGTPEQFDFRRALSQWGVYAAMSFIPVSIILKIRKQSFETVGITKKNMRLSFEVGIVLSILIIILSTNPEQFLSNFFSGNTLYAFIYYLAVGFGEELLFRGFLQLRCSFWLGELRGLILASTIMALAHLPQRIFALGLDPLQALISALSLMPFSLLMGFLMLRTRNILGPGILHTVTNWVSVV